MTFTYRPLTNEHADEHAQVTGTKVFGTIHHSFLSGKLNLVIGHTYFLEVPLKTATDKSLLFCQKMYHLATCTFTHVQCLTVT